MTCEPLEIVVVPFPFTDRQATKRRPALVVSSTTFNRRHDQTILAMITSATGMDWPSDVAIEDWRAAGLSVPCKVRLMLFTLDSALILRRIGKLGARDSTAVRDALTLYLCMS